MPGPPNTRMSSLEEPPLSLIGMTYVKAQLFFSMTWLKTSTKLLAAEPPLKTTIFLVLAAIAGTLFRGSEQTRKVTGEWGFAGYSVEKAMGSLLRLGKTFSFLLPRVEEEEEEEDTYGFNGGDASWYSRFYCSLAVYDILMI